MSAPLDIKTLEAAAQWYVTLSQGNEHTQHAHRQWLESDPRHAKAWERVERLQATFGRLDGHPARRALQSATASRRTVLKVLSLLVVGGGLGLGAKFTPWESALASHRTGAGERSSLRLSDGSGVMLNTSTALDVDLSPSLRLLTLHHGEILVQTAADPAGRPFVVQTPQGRVRALGTRFMVRSDGQSAQVAVIEHAVVVSPSLAPDSTARVQAGQRISFTETHLGVVGPTAKDAEAWSRGQLVIRDWSLGTFIEELARYRVGYLGCAPSVATLRISGAFLLDDIELVLDNLSGTLPVRVRRFTRYWAQVEPV